MPNASPQIPLTSKEFALIEELVMWGVKVKQIVLILHNPAAEIYAKKRYQAIGVRPPNGVQGSAVSKALKLTMKMHYASLARQYQNCLARDMDRRDAMLSVYRLYWREYRQSPSEDKVKASIWISTTRNLDVGIEALQECHSCGGSQLITVDALPDLNAQCMWCNHPLPAFNFTNDMRKFHAREQKRLIEPDSSFNQGEISLRSGHALTLSHQLPRFL